MTISVSLQKKGFTLLEVLVVVALIGLIAGVGFVPLVHSMRTVEETQKRFSSDSALRMACSRMVQDMERRYPKPVEGMFLFRLLRRERLGGKGDDVVMAWSALWREGRLLPGTVIFYLEQEAFLEEGRLPGLYRLFLSRKMPGQVDIENLPKEGAQLILPQVDHLEVKAHDGSIWRQQYAGDMPMGIRIILKRGEEEIEYTDWFVR